MDQAQKDYFYSRKFNLMGRIVYTDSLTTPKVNDRNQLKYSVLFMWDIKDPKQQELVADIGQFLQTAKLNFFPQFPDLHFIKPIKKFGEYVKQDGSAVQDFLQGKYWINANASGGTPEAPDTRFKPVVVDQNHQAIADPAQIYSGRNAVLNFSFYCYGGTGAGKTGIGVNIGAVMLLDGGETIEGSGGVDTKAAFGGFAADMGIQGAAAPMGMPPQAPVQQQYAPPVAPVAPMGMPPQGLPPVQQQYAPPVAPVQQQYAPPVAPVAPVQQQAPQQNPQYNPNTPPFPG